MIRLSTAEAEKLGLRKAGAGKKKPAATASSAPKTKTLGKAKAANRQADAQDKTRPGYLLRLMTYTMPRCKLGPEDREAKTFSDQLRLWTLQGHMNCVWWHTASELAGGGGRAAQIRYAIAKALGLIPGSPDYVFLHATKGAFAIELKAARGVLTPSQKDFQAWCEQAGVPYVCARGAEAAIQQLHDWGLVEVELPAAAE